MSQYREGARGVRFIQFSSKSDDRHHLERGQVRVRVRDDGHGVVCTSESGFGPCYVNPKATFRIGTG